jgi:TonB family protein
LAYPSRRISRLFVLPLALLWLSLGLPASIARAETASPKPIERANPEYPRTALRAGIEGSVLVEFSVDGRGRVVAPRVIDAIPIGVFEGAALEAVSKWRYEALGAETSNLKVRLTFRKEAAPSFAARVAVPGTPGQIRDAAWTPPLPPAAATGGKPAAIVLPPRPVEPLPAGSGVASW